MNDKKPAQRYDLGKLVKLNPRKGRAILDLTHVYFWLVVSRWELESTRKYHKECCSEHESCFLTKLEHLRFA